MAILAFMNIYNHQIQFTPWYLSTTDRGIYVVKDEDMVDKVFSSICIRQSSIFDICQDIKGEFQKFYPNEFCYRFN